MSEVSQLRASPFVCTLSQVVPEGARHASTRSFTKFTAIVRITVKIINSGLWSHSHRWFRPALPTLNAWKSVNTRLIIAAWARRLCLPGLDRSIIYLRVWHRLLSAIASKTYYMLEAMYSISLNAKHHALFRTQLWRRPKYCGCCNVSIVGVY